MWAHSYTHAWPIPIHLSCDSSKLPAFSGFVNHSLGVWHKVARVCFLPLETLCRMLRKPQRQGSSRERQWPASHYYNKLHETSELKNNSASHCHQSGDMDIWETHLYQKKEVAKRWFPRSGYWMRPPSPPGKLKPREGVLFPACLFRREFPEVCLSWTHSWKFLGWCPLESTTTYTITGSSSWKFL